MSVYLRNTKKVAVAKRRDNLTLHVSVGLIWLSLTTLGFPFAVTLAKMISDDNEKIFTILLTTWRN